MSLDVYLTRPRAIEDRRFVAPDESGIFVRENGRVRKITREEWDARFPGVEPVVAACGDEGPVESLHSSNYTHNCVNMAKAAGIYREVWRPEEIGITKAAQLIKPLECGIAAMKQDPDKFKRLNPPNGWGSYETFVPWLEEYLAACRQYPDADVSVSR